MNVFLLIPDLLSILRKNKIDLNSLRERKCWECGYELDFLDYISVGSKSDLFYRIKLWETDYIEFYCCKCFKKKKEELSATVSKYICPGKIFMKNKFETIF